MFMLNQTLNLSLPRVFGVVNRACPVYFLPIHWGQKTLCFTSYNGKRFLHRRLKSYQVKKDTLVIHKRTSWDFYILPVVRSRSSGTFYYCPEIWILLIKISTWNLKKIANRSVSYWMGSLNLYL